MKKHVQPDRRVVPALKVRQWLVDWNKVRFDAKLHRRRPDDAFLLFSMSAPDLKALSGISRRTTHGGLKRSEDLGIQRRHDEQRSRKIRDFVRYGYPWSDLSSAQRESGTYDDLRKPGWLPTAVVINILRGNDVRRGRGVAKEDLIGVSGSEPGAARIELPKRFTGPGWKPHDLHPIEVVDGQHRLWAFEDSGLSGPYELPVVAFHGLDISWQAYLFWTINITPKRINASLAFDLYPLLRSEDWLERVEGHAIYRETRAQELTAVLWGHPESPWHDRINMLGERGLGAMVTQAAWIRSLMATYIKAWEGRRVRIGGLFGSRGGAEGQGLPWTVAQQAAFLIAMGTHVREAVKKSGDIWAKNLRQVTERTLFDSHEDPAFGGPFSLLSTDQGIRGLLYVTNDLVFVRVSELGLEKWRSDDGMAADEVTITRLIKSLSRHPIDAFLAKIARALASFDWRASSTPDLSQNERIRKAALRGSGGYKELRQQLLSHLASQSGDVGKAAGEVLDALRYDSI